MVEGTDLLTAGALLVAGAFIPAFIYLFWIRNVERYRREPWGPLFKAFAWGATGGVVLALLLEVVFEYNPFQDRGVSAGFWVGVVVAPLAEEFAKALGLTFVRDDDPEPEDGYIYGAAAGLGFAATENVVYGGVALAVSGVAGLAATLILRSVASTLVHAGASAILGYGIWNRRAGRNGWGGLLAAYLVASGLHGAFNYLADLENALFALGAAVLIAVAVFLRLHARIRDLDRA